MYESFFHFTERPFAATPCIDRYYPGQAAEAARLAAARCIERAEGYAIVLGAAGTGKTLLCQVLAEQFRATLTPVLLSAGQIASRKALLQAILFELGLPFKRRDEGELRLALLDRISNEKDTTEGLLLLIDEAQSLRARLFEELRLLSNVVRQGKVRVRMVLTGTAALEERLSHAKLTSFQQRVTARSTLRAFSAAETQEYVRAQTAVVGGDPDAIWGDDALLAIHAATDGVPRLINQVCDHALRLAATAGMKRLGARGIEVAWADLQQLPLPQQAVSSDLAGDEQSEPREAVIEFGSLDEELDPGVSEVSPALDEVSGFEVPDAEGDPCEPALPSVHHESEYFTPEVGDDVEFEEIEAPHADDAVYDDFPIIACRRSQPDAVLPECDDDGVSGQAQIVDTEAIDWQPVPLTETADAGRWQNGSIQDPVLPEPASAGMTPLRTFATGPFESMPVILDPDYEEGVAVATGDPVDVVTEEDVLAPTYDPALRSGWPPAQAATVVQARQQRSHQSPAAPKRELKFGQLFSTMRQRQDG